MALRQRTKRGLDSSQDSAVSREEKDALIPPSSESEAKSSTSTRLSLFSVIGLSIVLIQIFCEVTKQISNYSLQYFSQSHYPIPQTVIVVACELIKLTTTIFRAGFKLPSFSLASLKGSLRFLLPSILYAVNNNIYYAGLMLVPPPIWLILCSIRTVVTASVYRFVLRRHLTCLQFVGVILIVISIGVAKTPDLIQIMNPVNDETVRANLLSNQTQNGDGQAETSNNVNAVPLTALLLALVASCNSVGGAVYTEQLFKSTSNKGETFLDQQFWLYSYGAVVASIVHFVSRPQYGMASLAQDFQEMNEKQVVILIVALLFASLGGIVVASILKYLDNIVKEYTGSVANILTAVASSILFPDKFKFTPFIVMSMACLLTGIYLYETKKAKNVDKANVDTKK